MLLFKVALVGQIDRSILHHLQISFDFSSILIFNNEIQFKISFL